MSTPSTLNIAALVPELVKGLPAAFVTLVIGLIAAGIAFRQYRIARAKFKLDLFDKRHVVFLETWAFISLMLDPKRFIEVEEVMAFRREAANARFLFGSDIKHFVDVVEKKSLERGDAIVAVRKAATEAERNEAARLVEETSDWATREVKLIHDRFSSYLDFSNWR